MSAVLPTSSTGLAADLEACYSDLVRQLTRSIGCPDRARELAHDTWLKLVSGPSPASEVVHARAYLLSTAQHLAIDGIRRSQRHDIVVDDLAQRVPKSAPDIADQVAHRQALHAVERALAALPQRTRQAFLAHRLEGTGHDELAAMHGVSRSAIERDLQRAHAAVRLAIEHWHGPGAGRRSQEASTSRRRSLSALLGMTGLLGGTPLLWNLWQQQVPQWQATLTTPRGRMARHTLPDGSELTLDADSEVRAAYFGTRRELQLLRGAAFFAVVHDASRPFSVGAAGTRVTVLGTRFAVDLDGSAGAPTVRVAVQSGRVRVQPEQASARSVDLGPGDALSVASDGAGGAPSLRRGKAEAAPWREGWLSFSHTPLGQAAARINRYRAAPVQVHPGAANLPVSGELRIASADEWLRLLPQALPVRVRTAANGELMLLPR
jgi:transmembrane sensor